MGNVIYCTNTHVQSFAYGDGAYRGRLPHQERKEGFRDFEADAEKNVLFVPNPACCATSAYWQTLLFSIKSPNIF